MSVSYPRQERAAAKFTALESADAIATYAAEIRSIIKTRPPSDSPEATDDDRARWELVGDEMKRMQELLDRLRDAVIQIDGR